MASPPHHEPKEHDKPPAPSIKNLAGDDHPKKAEQHWPPYALHQFHGFWIPGPVLPALLSLRRHFTPRPTDILLVTNPKSGTTWLKALAFSALHHRRHHPLSHHHPLLSSSPHDLVPFLETLYLHGAIPDLSALPSPHLFATHTPFSLLPDHVGDSNCKIIYLCRDPKDTLISLWSFTNKLASAKNHETMTMDVALEKFCEGVAPFGPWWDQAAEYWRESRRWPEKVLFMRYETMMRDPEGSVRRMAEFMGCSFASEDGGVVEEIVRLCSFQRLSSLEVNEDGGGEEKMKGRLAPGSFFRKGEVRDWVNHLSPEMAGKLDAVAEEKLRASGLSFV